MKNITYLKAERDSLQRSVDQINNVLKNKRSQFSADQIVLLKRKKKLFISELKKIRETINNF